MRAAAKDAIGAEMSAGPILAAGFAALLATQPAPSQGGAPAGEAAEIGRREAEAQSLLRGRRHREAAAAFEALHAETGAARHRLQAAQAREAAGQLAHAIAQWRALLSEETATPAQRAEAEARLAALSRKVAALQVRAETGFAAPVRLTLRLVAADERPPLSLSAAEAGRLVELDPGVWDIVATAPGHRPAQRVLTVAAPAKGASAPAELVLTLAPDVRAVTLPVGPPAALAAGVTLTLRAAEDVATAPERREQVVRATSGTPLSLAPGRWQVRAEAPGFVAQEAAWTVGEGPPPALALAPVPAPPAPPPPRATPDTTLPLGLGLGLPGGLLFGTGVGLVIQHRRVFPRFTPAPGNAAYVASVNATEVGAALLGGGLGLGAAALTAGLGARDRALWAELAAGGALATAGVAWYATEYQRVQKMLHDGGKDHDLDGMPDGGQLAPLRREAAAAALLGAGTGLALGAGVALLTRFLVARAAARPRRVTLGAGPWGASLAGRF